MLTPIELAFALACVVALTAHVGYAQGSLYDTPWAETPWAHGALWLLLLACVIVWGFAVAASANLILHTATEMRQLQIGGYAEAYICLTATLVAVLLYVYFRQCGIYYADRHRKSRIHPMAWH